MRNTRNSKNNNGSASLEIFTTWSDDVLNGGRLDAKYWLPAIRELQKAIQNGKYKSQKLGDFITDIRYGLSTANDYVDFGIPFLRILNLKNDGIDISDVVYLSEDQKDEIGKAVVHEGDLLISRSGSVGIVVVVPKEAENFAFGSFMIKFCLNEKINKQFIAAWLNSEASRKLIEREKIGAIQGNITIETIKNFDIPIPPLSVQNEVVKKIQEAYEQKKKKETEILKILSSIDDFVLGELGIDMPRGGAERVFQIWSDETFGNRIDAEYYNPIYKLFYKALSSGKYKIAEIDNIATAVFQGVGKNETKNPAYTLLKVKNIKKNNEIEFENVEFVKEVPENKVLKVGDIISPFIGEAVRQCKFSVFENKDGKFAVDNNTGVIRIDDKKVSNEYVAYILNSEIGRVQLKHLIGGGGVPFLGAGNAKKLKIPLPPIATQNKIVDKIGAIYAKAKRLRQEAGSIIAGAEKQVEQMILA
ncbi:restriction endonuclease subunit S [Patescibacteria group bacterium]|nr:restriction endonuclease subunit S [Patescibacteria group bacterium]